MPIHIVKLDNNQKDEWDDFVKSQPHSNSYQLAGWGGIIERAYRHKTYYLMAVEEYPRTSSRAVPEPSNTATQNHNSCGEGEKPDRKIIGVLPLIHLKHFLFGNGLISIPFFDVGGILTDSKNAEEKLLEESIKLATGLKVDFVELRHAIPLGSLEKSEKIRLDKDRRSVNLRKKSYKVQMLMRLPDSAESLMKSFKSKLRSQIKKPIKEGLSTKIGQNELLADFYTVFAHNMRELGSPVHSKYFIRNAIEEHSVDSKIFVIYKNDKPVAASLVVGFKGILKNPWSSSLREFSRMAPNMLLYWKMLEYACDNKYKIFDFGRSTPGEGTFKFKEQWGASPAPLYWYYMYLLKKPRENSIAQNSKFELLSRVWKRLPLPLTNFMGPKIRRYINL